MEQQADRVVAAVQRDQPDVALIDVQMPPFEHFHALTEVMGMEPGRRPQVLVLSANDDPGVRRRAQKLGADAFLSNPWAHDELVALVDRLTGASSA